MTDADIDAIYEEEQKRESELTDSQNVSCTNCDGVQDDDITMIIKSKEKKKKENIKRIYESFYLIMSDKEDWVKKNEQIIKELIQMSLNFGYREGVKDSMIAIIKKNDGISFTDIFLSLIE